ncbi:MAG TPA: DUF2934 domain-containing protein [Bryobacteraceae bacterium]|nr:DUF2934 domain-containing protein [Bryobacteraceae bacterium]
MSIAAVPEPVHTPYAVETPITMPMPDESASTEDLTDDTTTNTDDISLLAYALWQQRGCPDGSPEIDWLEAESQLNDKPQE